MANRARRCPRLQPGLTKRVYEEAFPDRATLRPFTSQKNFGILNNLFAQSHSAKVNGLKSGIPKNMLSALLGIDEGTVDAAMDHDNLTEDVDYYRNVHAVKATDGASGAIDCPSGVVLTTSGVLRVVGLAVEEGKLDDRVLAVVRACIEFSATIVQQVEAKCDGKAARMLGLEAYNGVADVLVTNNVYRNKKSAMSALANLYKKTYVTVFGKTGAALKEEYGVTSIIDEAFNTRALNYEGFKRQCLNDLVTFAEGPVPYSEIRKATEHLDQTLFVERATQFGFTTHEARKSMYLQRQDDLRVVACPPTPHSADMGYTEVIKVNYARSP